MSTADRESAPFIVYPLLFLIQKAGFLFSVLKLQEEFARQPLYYMTGLPGVVP
jgi:hypothetical protein